MKEYGGIKGIVIVLSIVMGVSLLIAGSIFFTGNREGLSLDLLFNNVPFFDDNYTNTPGNERNGISFGGERYAIDQTEVINMGSVEAVKIKTISAPINVFYTEGTEEIKVHYYGETSTNGNRPELEMKQTGDQVTFTEKREKQINIGFNYESTTMDVYLPAQYKQHLAVQSVSGKILADTIQLEQVTLETVSGNIAVNQLAVEEGEATSISGKIFLDQVTGKIQASTISGEIEAYFNELNGEISMNSTSGKIYLSLPQSAEFQLDARSLSGKVSTDFPVTLQGTIKNNVLEGAVGDGEHQVELETISGSILITY